MKKKKTVKEIIDAINGISKSSHAHEKRDMEEGKQVGKITALVNEQNKESLEEIVKNSNSLIVWEAPKGDKMRYILHIRQDTDGEIYSDNVETPDKIFDEYVGKWGRK